MNFASSNYCQFESHQASTDAVRIQTVKTELTTHQEFQSKCSAFYILGLRLLRPSTQALAPSVPGQEGGEGWGTEGGGAGGEGEGKRTGNEK